MNLYRVVQSHLEQFKDMLYTSTVAEIVSVNYKGESIESINVRPSINSFYDDKTERQKPVLNNVPVIFPSGGGGIISFPLQVGDTVVLVFAKEDITQFLKDKSPALPDTRRKFSINDAIAFPCIFSDAETLNPSKDSVEIKFKGSSVKIDPEGNVNVNSIGEVNIDSSTRATVRATESITVQSPTLLLDCENVTVNGSLSVSEGISTDGDISTSSIPSINNHKHSGVRTGEGLTGVPTA